jgi:hypothetical protein
MPVLCARLPEEIVLQIMDFAYGVPADNKKCLLDEIRGVCRENCYEDECSIQSWIWAGTLKTTYDDDHGHYKRIQQYPRFYRRTDEAGNDYEDCYLEETVPQDYPRNQLHLYKRYARQLEQQIQLLKQQLQHK